MVDGQGAVGPTEWCSGVSRGAFRLLYLKHRAKESSHLETQTNTDKNNPPKPALSRQRTRKGAARQDKKLLGNNSSSLEKHHRKKTHCGPIPPVPTKVKWKQDPTLPDCNWGLRLLWSHHTAGVMGERSKREEITVAYRQWQTPHLTLHVLSTETTRRAGLPTPCTSIQAPSPFAPGWCQKRPNKVIGYMHTKT